MLILCILLALACTGLGFWAWAQRRSLRSAARQLRALEENQSGARVRLAVPNGSAEALLDEVNRLLELRQADQSAYRQREKALRQQIANVSHDLRTPLTSILGYLQLLDDPGLAEEERKEYLSVVESRARALQSLITSFYDLSRLEVKDKYSMFLGGNQGLCVIKNPDAQGGKLLVIRDSYADSLAPFLSLDYQEVHLFDLRYNLMSLKQYVVDNNIDQVLVLYSNSNFSTDSNLALLGM